MKLYKITLEFFGTDYKRSPIQTEFFVELFPHVDFTEGLIKAKLSWLWMIMDPDVKYRIVEIEKVEK